jgi:hypothetical protein
MFGVDAATGDVTFRDPNTNGNYLTADASAKTFTVLSGSTLQVDGTLTVGGTATIDDLTVPANGSASFGGGGTVNVNAAFNLQQSSTTYLQWRPWVQTLAVQTGGKVSVESGGTLELAAGSTATFNSTPAFNRSFERGDESRSFVYGDGSASWTLPYGDNNTTDCFIIDVTFTKPFDNIPHCVMVPRKTSYTTSLISCSVWSVSTTAVSFVVALRGTVSNPMVYEWMAIGF